MNKVTIEEHLRLCAEMAKRFAGGLVSELAETASAAMDEMDRAKADMPKTGTVLIPPDASKKWQSDGKNAPYVNYTDISISGAAADDRIDITVEPSSLTSAGECGLCPTTESLDGAVRVRAVAVPTLPISVRYRIESTTAKGV